MHKRELKWHEVFSQSIFLTAILIPLAIVMTFFGNAYDQIAKKLLPQQFIYPIRMGIGGSAIFVLAIKALALSDAVKANADTKPTTKYERK
jgi:multidrug transporter EmrE-like cation transporter